MRITKKDVYAKYNIEYANGKINSPIGWIAELLKDGNSKTGKAVKTWSMNQTTCPCHCKGCYGDNGCYHFPSVKKSLANNTTLAREYLDFVERAIRAQLETFADGTEIRIHALGDFFSAEYLEMWRGIVRDYPQHVFWTYTKVQAFEDAFNEYPNANIVKSIVKGFGFNFGHCDYVIDMYKALKAVGANVHICRCGIDKNQHCAGCHKCSECEYVLFVEHSTEYVATDDPRYAELVELVELQDK